MSKNINPKFDDRDISTIKFKIEIFLNKYTDNFQGLTASIVLKHIDTYAQLIHLYINDARPWSVAYSGGKDSTVTMDVCLRALLLIKHIYGAEKLNKTTHVMFSDTLLEMDPVIEGILKSIDEIQKFGDKHKLNVDVQKVSPETKNTYFSLLIGKGYMVTRRDNRWCTDRLKIQPQKKAILKLLNKHKNGFIAITGQRQDESVDRANRMESLTIDGSFKEHEFKNCNLYAPIEHWNSNDVWNHIYNHKLDWVDANTLGRVYAEAANDGGECVSLLEGFESGENPGCGKSARYGCWICTLFEKDKTLNNLTSHYDYMKHMEEFRNWLVQFKQAQWDNKRDVFIHGKHKMKKYDIKNHREGMQIPGGYTLLFRREILMKLMELERKVIKDRGMPLITDAELSYIQECWIEDGDTDMWVSKIAYDREVTIEPIYKKVLKTLRDVQRLENSNADRVTNSLGMDLFPKFTLCDRFYAQLSIQLEKIDKDSFYYIAMLLSNHDFQKYAALETIHTLPIMKMDFVNLTKENFIREEWENDKIDFVTFLNKYNNGEIENPQKNLFGNDGDYGTHFDTLDELEINGDLLQCETVSLNEKMRFLEEW